MRVLCAWCLKAGRSESEALVGEKPGEDIITHGICPEHRKVTEDQLAELRDEAGRQAKEAERQREEAERLREQVDP